MLLLVTEFLRLRSRGISGVAAPIEDSAVAAAELSPSFNRLCSFTQNPNAQKNGAQIGAPFIVLEMHLRVSFGVFEIERGGFCTVSHT